MSTQIIRLLTATMLWWITAAVGIAMTPEKNTETAGVFLGEFMKAEAAGPKDREFFLGEATTHTSDGSEPQKKSHKEFLELWEKSTRKRTVSEIAITASGKTIQVQITQTVAVGKLTHWLWINTMTNPYSLQAISLEIPGSGSEKKQKWKSDSIQEAEGQYLEIIGEETPTDRVGVSIYEEGPNLESVATPIEQPSKNRIGIAFIIRDKATKETDAATAFVQTGEKIEFKELRTAAARSLKKSHVFK